ncbi:MAG: hypothetical protein FWD69_00230 [Polyangiaceae bacterium]|nr:hypothetical protein [Polyangiaceae bacterium]
MKPIATRVGWADFGDYDHFGLRLYRDLAGNITLAGLSVFSLTGRRLADEDIAVLDDVAACCHVTEPRVWPLKLARLGASSGRPITGYLAGLAVLDGDFIGTAAIEASARTLVELRAVLEREDALVNATLKTKAIRRFVETYAEWPSVGVHKRRVDERVVGIRSCLARRGRSERPWWTLAEELWPIMRELLGIDVSAFDAIGAACLDLGLLPKEIGALSAILLQPQFLAHAFEGAMQRADELRCLPSEAIRYVGPEPRKSSDRRR